MDSFYIWRLKQCVETIPANIILDKQRKHLLLVIDEHKHVITTVTKYYWFREQDVTQHRIC